MTKRDACAPGTVVGPSIETAAELVQLRYREQATELADNLAQKLSLTNTDREARLRGLLHALGHGDHPDVDLDRAELFEQLCSCAGEAFGLDPTDAEVLSNAATPDLVRYVLHALQDYARRSSNSTVAAGKGGSGSRARHLAAAFKVNRPTRGSPSGKLEVDRRKLLKVAGRAYWQALREADLVNGRSGLVDPRSEVAAMTAAVDAAIAVFRSDNVPQDPSAEAATRKRLRAFLDREKAAGYL